MSPTRREFLCTTAAAGAFTILPSGIISRAGRLAPSDKLNVACIGVGGQGWSDVRGMAVENIYAMCDVDDRSAARAYKAFPNAKRYKDYREMIEKEAKNIDAITITIPDHSHAAAAMLALRAGKHVYCQKPLARTVHEVRTLMAEAARRPKQSTIMGNQGHAAEGVRQIREWFDAGILGDVREVHLWTNRPIWPQAIERPQQAYNVPPELDWNLWLGPSPERPYNPAYAPFNWRGWWDWGTGAMGDMACHIMDASYWTLQLKYPTKVIPESTQLFSETAPKSSRITYEFPARGNLPPLTLVWRDGGLLPPRPEKWPATEAWTNDDAGGQLWIGSKAMLNAGTYAENPRLVDPEQDKALRANPPAQKFPRTGGVHAEWIAAIKNGTQPGSNIPGYAGPLTEMIVLGNLAVRAGRTIELDPNTGKILTTGIPEEWMTPRYRAGWTL
jgi:predicted dehydrogenase